MRVFFALWLRDLLKLIREPSRWFGVVSQPLLFWFVMGTGIGNQFRSENYLDYFYPGIFVLVILFSSIFSAMSLIEDRQTGLLKFFMTLSRGRVSIVLGKVFGISSIVFVQSFVFLICLPLIGVSFLQVSYLSFFLVTFLGTVCLGALNICGAWLLNSVHAYHGFMSLLFIPLWMMSGALFPLEGTWMSVLSYLNPMSFMVDVARYAFFGQVIQEGALLRLVVATFLSLGLASLVVSRVQNDIS